MKYYCEDSQQVLQELNSQKSGLTEKEAAERLLQNGANELKAAKGKSLLRRFAEQVADPMIVILLAAAAISGVLAVLENDSFADVIIILAVVLINAVLGVYQESKAEKAIEALQDMAAATSKVVRDGKMSSILSKDLVVGDIICLEAGDAVPADARILESASLKAEEAALTGESVPVTKLIDQIFLADGERDVPLGDRKNMVYMGSTIVYGRASRNGHRYGYGNGKNCGCAVSGTGRTDTAAEKTDTAFEGVDKAGDRNLRAGFCDSDDSGRQPEF
mgnify:CR=1 FL=1